MNRRQMGYRGRLFVSKNMVVVLFLPANDGSDWATWVRLSTLRRLTRGTLSSVQKRAAFLHPPLVSSSFLPRRRSLRSRSPFLHDLQRPRYHSSSPFNTPFLANMLALYRYVARSVLVDARFIQLDVLPPSAIALLASYASATIVIDTPTNATSGEPITVKWSSQMGDPSSITLELSNPDLFHQAFAVGNNLDTSVGQVSFTMPTVQAE